KANGTAVCDGGGAGVWKTAQRHSALFVGHSSARGAIIGPYVQNDLERFFARPALLAENKIQPHAGEFDEIPIAERHWTGDRPAIDAGHFVAGAEIVAVIELIDLRSHLWFEPALKANRGHGGFSDDRELVGQNIFPLVRVSAENHQC